MRTRRLTLQRENLTALSTDDLANVAGAADHTLDLQCVATTPSVFRCPDVTLVCPPTSPCTT